MPIFDNHANFDYSLVATAPSPATSGMSLVVTAGQGALFPSPPFNLVVWPTGMQPLSTNAEIVRVTGVATDTFTIVRNTTTENNNTFNRTIVVGDQVAVPISYKMMTDAEFTDNITNGGTTTIPANNSLYIPDYLEISLGDTIEIALGATLEIG